MKTLHSLHACAMELLLRVAKQYYISVLEREVTKERVVAGLVSLGADSLLDGRG
jgi:hypothetical protein